MLHQSTHHITILHRRPQRLEHFLTLILVPPETGEITSIRVIRLKTWQTTVLNLRSCWVIYPTAQARLRLRAGGKKTLLLYTGFLLRSLETTTTLALP